MTANRWSSGCPARVLTVLTVVAVGTGCSEWLGDRHGDGGTSAPPLDTNGTCSGAPIPCEALNGADCPHSAGCVDRGTCTGTVTGTGEPCGTQSTFGACSTTPGCFWSAACTGTPLGSCTAGSRQYCLLSIGCVWTPNGTGGGGNGAGGACSSSVVACTSNADCTACGLSCVNLCSGCPNACGIPCLSNADCVGTTTAGVATPYCALIEPNPQPPFTGRCAATP